MSTPHPPSQQDPFPGMGDESLWEREEITNPSSPRRRSAESASTQAPNITDQQQKECSPATVPLAAIKATQNFLQLACKRKRLSSSGTKQQLVDRLGKLGVLYASEVRNLASEFEEKGADDSIEQTAKNKAPNWTCHEAARLCHVIADPRHATAVGRLYNKIENRAELDQTRHDPWSAEFVDLFNDVTYDPNVPDGRDGVTDGLLLSFDPTLHPHKRNGSFLKARWNKMRSKYTVAREKFTKSGQGENDVFETFTDGDDALAYMHCVFYGLPALEAVVRALPEGCGVEAGLNEISEARSTLQQSTSNKKRKVSEGLSESLTEIAKAVAAPIEVKITEQKEDLATSKYEEYETSDRIAGTVQKLMGLEGIIRANIRKAYLDEDEEYAEELRTRLANVQKRIDRALMD